MEEMMQTTPECCCHKTKQRTEKEHRDMINRLSRIEGQIRGIKGMIEKDIIGKDITVRAIIEWGTIITDMIKKAITLMDMMSMDLIVTDIRWDHDADHDAQIVSEETFFGADGAHILRLPLYSTVLVTLTKV